MEIADRTKATSSADVGTVQRLYERVPDLRETIQQRLIDVPEYRIWLQQYGHAILESLEP